MILSVYKLSKLKENTVLFRVDIVTYSLICLISLLKQTEKKMMRNNIFGWGYTSARGYLVAVRLFFTQKLVFDIYT